MMDWLPTDTTLLNDAAVLYAEHGFSVIPLWWMRADGTCACGKCEPDSKARAKHPLQGKWQKTIAADGNAALDARRKCPHANIGLVMGGDARIVAVDVDGQAGRESLARLLGEREMPVTLTSQSGRADGGAHYLFRVPAHLDMKRLGNRAGVNGYAGIDTRSEAGQIVVAPSRHHSGAIYRWTVRAPVADMPEWMYAELAQREERPLPKVERTQSPASVSRAGGDAYIAAALRNACAAIASQCEGGRNALLFAKATTIFEYYIGEGKDHVAAWGELSAAGVACGLPPSEVGGTLSKAWRQAQTGNVRTVPEREPQRRQASGGDVTVTTATVSDSPAWTSFLKRADKSGDTIACEYNATLILENDESFPRVSFDEFLQQLFIEPRTGGPRKAASDDAELAILQRLQSHHSTSFCVSHVRNAMLSVGKSNQTDVLRDHIAGLAWDGVPRLDDWLVRYLHAEDTRYSRVVGRKWMIQAVARALSPRGCKADATLVLTGKGGFRKSTSAEIIGGAFYTDEVADLGSKDCAMQIAGKWIIEMAENDAADRAGLQRLKAWLTRQADRYRPAYGRNVVEVPRRCVFIATTNEDVFLRDETGNRRWWPIKLTAQADTEGLREVRDQLVAEAAAAFAKREPWWLNSEEEQLAEEEQESRRMVDAWEQRIAVYLATHRCQEITISDLLQFAIGIEPGRWTQAEQNRVARALRALNWNRIRTRPTGGGRLYVYRPDRALLGPTGT